MLKSWHAVLPHRAPAGGWLQTVRQALGMSVAQFAARRNVSRQAAHELERREAEGAITLGSLREAADVLDCELVYALVPRSPSLADAVESRARMVAEQLLARARQTMLLESQPVAVQDHELQLELLTRRLLTDWPRDLWDKRWDSIP